MPVIAGTRKESVINKAREVLREKEIPYTIERTKTWFWVSSPKPATAQTALREAGLEMNPITTMHSIWCPKCGAIRTFKKRAGDWICQKCGARLLMFKNPKKTKPKYIKITRPSDSNFKMGQIVTKEDFDTMCRAVLRQGGEAPLGIPVSSSSKKNPIKAMVHPQALESLKRYKSDIKAGHLGAAEYWRGQAGAYFTANPQSFWTNSELFYLIKQEIKEYERYKPLPKHLLHFKDKNWLEKQTNKRLDDIYWMLRDDVWELEKRRKNPLTKSEKQKIINLANTQFAISRKYTDDPVRSSFWYGRSVGMGKIAKMFNPKVKKWDPISEILEGDEEEDNMIGAEINPLGAFICGRCGKRFRSMEALNTHLLKIHKVRNPLAAISSAAITGIGAGLGFRIAGWGWGKVAKNPVKPHTTAIVSKLPKCDFCARTAHYDGKTVMGPWAYMCEPHFEMYGVGLGLGKGQILIKK